MTATVRVSHRDGVSVVSVEGDIDLANASLVTRNLLNGVVHDTVALVVDLTSVGYIDSAGVRALFEVTRRVQEGRRALLLVLPDASPVRRLVRVTNLDTVAPVFASIDEAAGSLKTAPNDAP